MLKKLRLYYVSTERAVFISNLFIKLCRKKRQLFFKIIIALLRNILYKKYNIIIGDDSKIDGILRMPHPQCIVIGSGVKIGKNCVIYHDVTMGQNRGKYPQIGENVIIYPGAKVIGDVKIGDNVVIGANAVVTQNVGDNQIVCGIPAKQIGIKRSSDEFY
jgi:serine O-acetyltransferase